MCVDMEAQNNNHPALDNHNILCMLAAQGDQVRNLTIIFIDGWNQSAFRREEPFVSKSCNFL